jgi:hypothetical protein
LKVLETEINLEKYHEDHAVDHPFSSMSFQEVKEHMAMVEAKYPEYQSFAYVYNCKYLKYGASMGWYELHAEYRSELLKAID